jgi:monoamine oxidase
MLVLTVSLGVLQAPDALKFVPPLPALCAQQIARMGIDAGMKITLLFAKRFWPKYMGALYSTGPIQLFWSTSGGCKGPDLGITAFLMGDRARALAGKGEKAAIDLALSELCRLFKLDVRTTFLRGAVADWTANPYQRGAYSYPAVGSGGPEVFLFSH